MDENELLDMYENDFSEELERLKWNNFDWSYYLAKKNYERKLYEGEE